MSLVNTLVNGHESGLKHEGMTPMQKIALRFVVLGVLYYGVSAIEGMMMRVVAITPAPFIDYSRFFSVMTAHPMVGYLGSTYMIVFGVFLFVVPFLMKKPIFSLKLANATWMLIGGGTFIMWLAGFLFSYAPFHTLYWPLPTDFSRFAIIGELFYVAGIALIMVGTILYSYNIFKTIMYTPEGWDKQPSMELFKSAVGFTGLSNLFKKKKTGHLVDLPVVAISRGTIDVGLNAVLIVAASVLLLIFLFAAVFGSNLDPSWVDALLYKNIFWWGLGLITDGLVLIFVVGTWYLLATMITGKTLFMQNIARAVLFVGMVVSWTVWFQHLMSDQGQTDLLKVISGEVVTALELVTLGLAAYVTLVTLARARPLKMTNEVKFLLGGLLGFMLAVPAGLIQADMGMNRDLHNTQWFIGAHVHVAILVGLTMTLYSAIYLMLPILTNGAKLYSQKLATAHFWLHIVGGIGMGAFMGMAGISGMLRRSIYVDGDYNTFMIPAGICGCLLLLAFFAFLINVVMTVGVKGLIGIYSPATMNTRECVPAQQVP
jgi:cytochrome c oxidase subunit 1